MFNGIWFSIVLLIIILLGWYLTLKLNFKTQYKKHLITCHNLNIKPFNIFEYYYRKRKETESDKGELYDESVGFDFRNVSWCFVRRRCYGIIASIKRRLKRL
jgi:hypothetical protein